MDTSDQTLSKNESHHEDESPKSFVVENEDSVVLVQIQNDDFYHCIQVVNQKNYEKK